MARIQMSSFLIVILMCCIGTSHSAVTAGYFYENPIRPFNPPSFSSVRSSGQYPGIPFGQKVETTTQRRLKVPPIPSLPPLISFTPTQTTKYQSTFGRVQSTPNPYTRTLQQQVQRGQGFQPQPKQPQPQQRTQTQRPNIQIKQNPTPQPYSYPRPQVPVGTQFTSKPQSFNTITQRNNIPQSTARPTTQFFSISTTRAPIQKQTPKPYILTTVAPTEVRASVEALPTTASVINSNSNPTQTLVAEGLVASPDIYVVDGRQLKQYKVYEHIDNDIDQEVHNFIPANFFLNSYHSMIGDTHPLGEDLQVQNRASGFQQSSQLISGAQQQQQQTPNTVALGSGGLGFVKLPNGNVYLGSGSLGYISNLQHSQDVQNLRSRSSSSGPDALHFGHGPLSDSFYYQNRD